MDILLGFMVAAWLYTLGSGVYAFWRYVKKPWDVVRLDQLALNTRLDEHAQLLKDLQAELGKRKAIAFTPEQLASIEQDKRMSGLASAMERGLRI